MTARIEWRHRNKGDESVLLVGELEGQPDRVLKAWRASTELITDLLNDMREVGATDGALELSASQRDPQAWGKLVIARAQEGGDVLAIDPEPYWDGIYYWFRAHGLDPHPMRAR
jgi:hypothetical protein